MVGSLWIEVISSSLTVCRAFPTQWEEESLLLEIASHLLKHGYSFYSYIHIHIIRIHIYICTYTFDHPHMWYMYTVVKYTTMGGKSCVRLCRSSCDWEHIRKCYPPTAMCRNFCLLRFRPGPIRPLLSNLVDGNFHSRHHVDTQLRVDTRSTYTHRPQGV